MAATFTWPKDGVVLIIAVKGKMWGATINPALLEDMHEEVASAEVFEKYIKPAVHFIEQQIADYRIENAQKLLRDACKKTVTEKVM